MNIKWYNDLLLLVLGEFKINMKVLISIFVYFTIKFGPLEFSRMHKLGEFILILCRSDMKPLKVK
jgi:hypothetical protein